MERWDVMMVREYQDHEGKQRSFWTKIGAGFTNKDGSIGVQLDAYPTNGKLVLQIPMTKEEREARFGGHGQAMRQAAGQPARGGGRQQQQAGRYRQQRGPSEPQRGGFGFVPPGEPAYPDPEPSGTDFPYGANEPDEEPFR